MSSNDVGPIDSGSITSISSGSILAINAGSSSVKFGLFTFEAAPHPLCRGTIETADRHAILERLFERIGLELERRPIAGVGHRIVHGGPELSAPARVTSTLIDALTRIVPFAPNHLPDEIALIEAAQARTPQVPQFVCFDTAFHAGLPDVARRLPIPASYDAQGIRRYGFHGLSYTFLLDALRERVGLPAADGRIVLMHLGSGASLAAVREGRCIDTSMGFTPIAGIPMSSRSGDLDPGVVTYIARATKASADDVERTLSHESGLKGISGGIADVRDLLAREDSDPDCRLALAIFCYEIVKRAGAYAAALGGLDTVVFSGGIGEHAAAIRARICSGLAFLGVALDEAANSDHRPVISTATSRVGVHVIPTDEEIVIARAGYQLLTTPS